MKKTHSKAPNNRNAEALLMKTIFFNKPTMIKRTLSLVITTLTLMLLTGCVPITEVYYRPDANSGTVTKAWCPPVHSFMLIEVHDILIGFKVSITPENQKNVTITFEIPENHNVKLIDHFVTISDDSSNTAKGELTGHKWVSSGRTAEIPIDAPMLGSTQNSFFDQITLYGKTENAYFILSADVEIKTAETIYLKPPKFSLDGDPIDLPAIKFDKIEERLMGPINC